jgi:DNA-binding LytR/AlgR family response regulator
MKALIIEDETAAARNLKMLLAASYPEIDVIGTIESVAEAVAWFGANPTPELVFMDIHLADGESFRIFQSVDINIPIIFTTAYDEYALQAFKVNSIDYILKPYKEEDLRRALDKLERLTVGERATQKDSREKMVREVHGDNMQTMLLRYKDKLIPVTADEVALFYTSEERVMVTTLKGDCYPVDKTLESLSQQLSPEKFFRANRQFIVSRRAVKDIAVWFGSRLALNLTIETPERIIISKARVPEFKSWLQSVHAD